MFRPSMVRPWFILALSQARQRLGIKGKEGKDYQRLKSHIGHSVPSITPPSNKCTPYSRPIPAPKNKMLNHEIDEWEASVSRLF